MGWLPFLKPMIDNRVCPSVHCPSRDVQMPVPSGPRCSKSLSAASHRSLETPRRVIAANIPHILVPPTSPWSSRANLGVSARRSTMTPPNWQRCVLTLTPGFAHDSTRRRTDSVRVAVRGAGGPLEQRKLTRVLGAELLG